MIVKLAIITSSSTAQETQRLMNEAGIAGIDATTVLYGSPNTINDLETADRCIVRVGPRSVAACHQLASQLHKFSKQLENVLSAYNKIRASYLMKAAGLELAMPKTWVCDRDELETITTMPVVVKVPQGNQGKGVFLMRQSADAQEILMNTTEHEFVVQEFIAESAGRDKRLFVIDGRVVAAMTRRAAGDDFRSNLHAGGRGEKYSPTKEEADLAITTTKVHHLMFAGVDIIDSRRGPLVLEINPSPGFGIEEITGINVAEDIIRTLKEEVYADY